MLSLFCLFRMDYHFKMILTLVIYEIWYWPLQKHIKKKSTEELFPELFPWIFKQAAELYPLIGNRRNPRQSRYSESIGGYFYFDSVAVFFIMTHWRLFLLWPSGGFFILTHWRFFYYDSVAVFFIMTQHD